MKFVRSLIFSFVFISGAQSCDFCNQWSWNVQVGLAPTVWTNRQSFTAISCNAVSVLDLPNAIVPLFTFPQFNQLFHVPWIVGTFLSYEFDWGLNLFVQVDYRQAKERIFTIPNLVIPQIDTLSFSIAPQDSYRTVDCFVGLYYGAPFSCMNGNWFMGAKVGLLHRTQVDTRFITNSLTVPFENETAMRRLIEKSTSPAVGTLLGIDGCFNNCFSWCLQFEMVAVCGPRVNRAILFDFATESVFINPLLAPNGFINEGIQTEFYFPITFGFKYLL
ncbi:MAG: hypothetical protein AMXMBFR12_02290 [Candidatus Babeliales bacterium]